ncbi:MAG: hypothetical protein EXX96DRAFT_206694 [Benjaminiella poitrasii]|nr:MAG: hypothetical protein EXX96DRAFT_206694 [Benjaminiella poitrasii]
MITDKNQRRSILGELEQWNVGITPEGKLASTACFVHQAVPDIILNNNKHEILLPTVITARSDWTKNLIQQSGVSNPSDEITLKSLSLCKSLFIDHPQRVDLSPKSYYHHLNYCKIRAHVKMDKIARLTTDFEDELTRAQEHWPHHPQSSWDKLYQIWIKYGFLWPERLYLDYRQKEGNSSAPYLQSKLRKSEEQHERSQDQVQQQKENSYYIVWRANLRPMHEIFPESHHKQKDFIITVIHHCFSSLVLSERSLFRLKNVETGLYLGIQQEAAVMVDRDESFNWQFKDALTNKALPSSSFIFIGSSKVS